MARYPIEQHTFLRKSFIHLKGIGSSTEAQLWREGLSDWRDLHAEAPKLFKGKRLAGIMRSLTASMDAWERGELYHFHLALPSNERWRLIPGGEHAVAYFDIEASGGSMPPLAQSTAVAFYFRGEVLQEHDYRKKRELIAYVLEESSLLCSFNGYGYDVPFLSAEYGIEFRKAHVDLCPWLRRLGFKGGLKAIQRSLPHLHQRSSMDIDGFDAVRLWRMHERGIEGALSTLLTYNAEDAVILEPLLVEAFNREVDARPELGLQKLDRRPSPQLSTSVDASVYSLLRSFSGYVEYR